MSGGSEDAALPRTLDELMALALAMETAAAERYAELADTMQAHNNSETAELFRRMAGIEMRHAREIRAQIGRSEGAAGLASHDDGGAVECAPPDELHYLMLPYHALQIALANEKRAEHFFAQLAAIASSDAVRTAAERLRAEEHEHVVLIEQWLTRVPVPPSDWALDPDPPRYTD